MRQSSRRTVAAVVVVGLAASLAFLVSPASADSIRDREYWLNQYGITSAWNTTRGAGVTIAIIDTGVDSPPLDQRGAVVGGPAVSRVGRAGGPPER